jgi:predicted regulator of Ras-like GTPase activity (Roadblock/LC7/MglB family)
MTKSVFKEYLEKIVSEINGVHSVFLISSEGIIIEEVKIEKSLSGDEIAAYITNTMKSVSKLLKQKMKGDLQEAIFITDNLKSCLFFINDTLIMLNLKQDGEFSKGRQVLKKYARKIQQEL